MNAQRTRWASIVGIVVLFCGTHGADAYVGFGRPVNLKSVIPVLDPRLDGIDCLSYDGLEMFVFAVRPEGYGAADLWVSKRASADQEWGPLENLGSAVNSPKDDSSAAISADGLELCFASNRSTTWPDIYVTTRATRTSPWGPAVSLGPTVNSPVGDGDCTPWLSADGLELYLVSWRAGGRGESDIYVARRATRTAPWSQPVNLGPTVNSAYADFAPCLSSDGLFLIFSDISGYPLRPNGYGESDIYMTRRISLAAPWEAPVNLGPRMNSSDVEAGPRLSPDGRMLYFWTGHDEDTWTNWQSAVVPVVDFNGDGAADAEDDLILAACLGQNDPLCDIGPSPWGDGIVDAEDQTVLAEYLGKEVYDSTLLAHWALDETEGAIAQDSAGSSKGFAMGNPVWQPDGGKVGGTLAFDGVDDVVITGHVLGLGTGPFALVGWVQGGAPGQVLLYHRSGTKWLYIDPLSGSLTADFRGPGRSGPPLVSDAAITDGLWHRVGLVWDGTSRILYVDGEAVAADSSVFTTIPDNGFMIGGTGPGTFWSGLIDDVRLYNRAVKP